MAKMHSRLLILLFLFHQMKVTIQPTTSTTTATTTISPPALFQPGCNYTVVNINGGQTETITTMDEEIGRDIIELTILNRDFEEITLEEPDDVYLAKHSPYIQLTLTVDIPNIDGELKACIAAGHSETFEVSIGQRLDPEKRCNSTSFTILVEPETPEFIVPYRFFTDIGSCKPGRTIEIRKLMFNKLAQCIFYKCNVTCKNKDKVFWITKETMLETSVDGIEFGFTYELLVKCTEAGISLNSEDNTAENIFWVIFGNRSGCSSATEDTTILAPFSPSSIKSPTTMVIPGNSSSSKPAISIQTATFPSPSSLIKSPIKTILPGLSSSNPMMSTWTATESIRLSTITIATFHNVMSTTQQVITGSFSTKSTKCDDNKGLFDISFLAASIFSVIGAALAGAIGLGIYCLFFIKPVVWPLTLIRKSDETEIGGDTDV